MSRPYLKFLDIYCGAFCNLACNYCDARSHVIQTKDYDPELEDILNGVTLSMEKFDVVYCGVSGGEPLLYLEKLERIFDHVRKINPSVTLMFSTNGTLIDKKIDKLVEIINKFKINIFVCDHFSAFDDKKLSSKVKNNFYLLANRLSMQPGNVDQFYKNLFDTENQSDAKLREWIHNKADMLENVNPAEEVFYKDTFLHYREQSYFKKNYTIVDGKPKPFATNDPELSYRHGCSSEMCSYLVGKKLYKCAALGTLERFLNSFNLLEDPDWQKYLNYKPIDLENCSTDEIEFFDKTKFCSINECDMCPTKDIEILKTPENVLKK